MLRCKYTILEITEYDRLADRATGLYILITDMDLRVSKTPMNTYLYLIIERKDPLSNSPDTKLCEPQRLMRV